MTTTARWLDEQHTRIEDVAGKTTRVRFRLTPSSKREMRDFSASLYTLSELVENHWHALPLADRNKLADVIKNVLNRPQHRIGVLDRVSFALIVVFELGEIINLGKAIVRFHSSIEAARSSEAVKAAEAWKPLLTVDAELQTQRIDAERTAGNTVQVSLEEFALRTS